MKSALSAAATGLTVISFTGVTTASVWTSGTVVLPEFERSRLYGTSFSSSMQTAIRSYVNSGGVYVVAGEL